MTHLPDRPLARLLAEEYRTACYLDVESFKPGNVSLASPGHGMTAADFLRSAEHSVAPLVSADASLGERVRAAVAATRVAVCCNTNLGIVLLAAPLVQACLSHPQVPLRVGVARILAASTRADASAVYAAIRLASPGGLGDAVQQDVADEPDVTLIEAMRLAADHDLVARQYANGYEDLIDVAVPYLDDALLRFNDTALALTDLYLYLLAGFPDSHVARKHGGACAETLRLQAGDVHADFLAAPGKGIRRALLRQYDGELQQRGINPGTTADLCVAAFFFHRLQQRAVTHAVSAPDYTRIPSPVRGTDRIIRLANHSKENRNGSHYQDPRG